MDSKSYGLHLMIDAYGAPGDKLSDVSLLRTILSELPGLIRMRRVSEPQIMKVEEEGIAGLSGFVFIMESHISLHTYSERRFVSVDIYSCKPFDTDAAQAYLREAFGYESCEANTLERGRRFYETGDPNGPPQSEAENK